jgi:uncharacterized membrane protein YjfL (UPF0719 family)
MLQHLNLVLLTIGYAAVGTILLWLTYLLFDRLTPGDAHGKIFDEGNRAVAILFGAFLIGVAIIIAAAIVG